MLGLAPVAGTVIAVSLGLMLVMEGWRAERVQTFRETASRLRKAPELARHETPVAYLQAAAALAPEYGILHAELAEAQLELMREKPGAQTQRAQSADTVQAALACTPPHFPAEP